MRIPLFLGALSIASASCGTDPVPPVTGIDASAPDGNTCTAGAYPPPPYAKAILSTIPDLRFQSDEGDIALRDYYEPCAARSRLAVLRVGAPWCGNCRWHLGFTKEMRAWDIGERLRILDLTLSDRDNFPATGKDAAAYRALIANPDRVGADGDRQLIGASGGAEFLPLYVVLDTRTMQIRIALSDPAPTYLEFRLRDLLASLDRVPSPAEKQEVLYDGQFPRSHWDMIKEMTLPGAPPADTTNAKADDAAAAALGKALFSDAKLSPNNVACATCHDPAKALGDGLPQSIGVAKVDRNAPAIALASHSRWQFWDGRADTLWAQALGPPENDKEMATTRLYIAHQIYDRYKAQYEAIFGALPALSNAARFPATGKPGDAAWLAMTAQDRDDATRVYVNMGKSIAAFERTFRVKPSRLDAYVAGDLNAMTVDERRGFHSFFTSGCTQCHWGPRLTDDAFHVVRFPTGKQDGSADTGRSGGIPQLVAGEFLASSGYSDDASAAKSLTDLAPNKATLGAFKTPSLRGVALSAPYGHGGTFAALFDAVDLYSTGGVEAGDPRSIGELEPWLPKFAKNHRDDIVLFLGVLNESTTIP